MCRDHLGRLPSLPHYFLLLQRVGRCLVECHMCGRQEGGHHSLLSLFLYGLLPVEWHMYTAATIVIQPRSVWSASCEEPQDRRAVNSLLSIVHCGLISGECHMCRADLHTCITFFTSKVSGRPCKRCLPHAECHRLGGQQGSLQCGWGESINSCHDSAVQATSSRGRPAGWILV